MKLRKRIIPFVFSFLLVFSPLFILSSIKPAALFDNLGFESDLTGWSSGSTVGISVGEVVNTSTFVWTVNQNQSKMAKLQPTGPSGAFNGVADALAMPQDSREYIVSVFPSITNIAYLHTDLELAAGESFSMAWNYIATDYVPFNDASFTTFVNLDDASVKGLIDDLPTSVTILGATVPGTGNYSTGSYASTGWQTTTYTAVAAGTYRLGFTAYNLKDTYLSPILFVDKEVGTTLKNGEDFGPIQPDDNPPPPPVTTAPVLSTLLVSDITNTGATLDVTVSSDGGEDLSACGFYLAIHENPTADDIVLSGSCIVGKNTLEFSSASVHTTYYYKAFATNSVGTTVSDEGQFTTLKNTPTLTFEAIVNKTYGDSSFTLVAETSSASPILYVSSDPAIASIEGNTVTLHDVGDVVITASVAENDTEYGSSTTQPLTILKKELVIKVNPSEKTYGEADPQFSVDYDGFAYEDDANSLEGELRFSRDAKENVGSVQVVAQGLTSDQYTISYEGADLVILPRPLIVTVQPAVKVYGSNDPKFTVAYRGFAFDDTSALVQGLKITRKAGQNVGSYPIVASNATAENYVVSYENATLTILKKDLTITVLDQVKVYGDADPVFTVRYDGFVYGDDDSAVGGLLVNRNSGEMVGDYVLSVAQAASNNYQLGFVSGKLTIQKAALTLKVDDAMKVEGEDDPAFTFTIQGLKNNDTKDAVQNVTFQREAGEDVANYAVSIKEAQADNYALTFVQGTLTIEKKPSSGFPTAGLISAGVGIPVLFFLIFFFKRRKKQDEE